jgi:hypothetical protein
MTGTVRIVGRQLPGRDSIGRRNIHVGMQRRADPVDLVPGDADEAVFDVELDVVTDPSGGPDYRGPFVHGRRGDRFVYLTWGEVDGDGTFAMFRRAKLKLATVPSSVAAALASGQAARAELVLTADDGGPLCAAIPPQAISWTVRPA